MKKRSTLSPTEIMHRNAEAAAGLLKLLANARRLMILCHLVKEEKTVTELANIAVLSHSAMSQHLMRMRREKLVESHKQGQKVYYRLASPEIGAILSTLYLIYCRQ